MARRDDPSYAQLSGYIKKEVVKEFKMACTDLEVSQVDAIEEAINLWLKNYRKRKTTEKEAS
ncbi:hypothetical protein ACSQ6I_03905 [Anabaena sp. WFMT]|uniref:hypothetical protein n=1 Tax=Anabaena sp. WFMT TaxID=3449730 RepID=UPI003F22CC31